MTNLDRNTYPISLDQWGSVFRWPRWRLERGMKKEKLNRILCKSGMSDPIRLLFCGDIMVKSHDRVPLLHSGIASVINSADLFFGTLESPVTESPCDPDVVYPNGGQSLFNMPVAFLEGLFRQTGLGYERICLSLAANHASDQGIAGFESTKGILDSLGVNVVGVFENGAPPMTVLAAGPLKIGVVAWTEWMNNDPFDHQKPGVMRDHHVFAYPWKTIARARDLDCLIAMPHWELEMRVTPLLSTTTLAKRLIEEHGFSFVCGSHPHMIQALELIGDGLCHYSLSNFTYTLSERCCHGNSWMTCLSALLEVNLDRETGKITSYRVHPFIEHSVSDTSELILLSDYRGENRNRYEALLSCVFERE
jgi:Bacterial capsule synthesis protein PGA_cap